MKVIRVGRVPISKVIDVFTIARLINRQKLQTTYEHALRENF